jgi:hypothetical protein
VLYAWSQGERAQKDITLETVARFADAFGIDMLLGDFCLTATTVRLRRVTVEE